MDATQPARPFTTAELGHLGITKWRLRTMIQRGEVRRVIRGVYAPADLPDTIEVRLAAFRAAVGTDYVAVDRTAAWLHGVDVLPSADPGIVPPIEVCTLPTKHPSARATVDGHRRELADDDVMRLGEILVTTPLRTSMDLGCCLRRRDAFAALNMFAREHSVTAAEIVRRLPRYRGRRGIVQLRELTDLIDARIESARESWVFLAILDAGLPRPEPQVWVEEDGVPIYRLDFAYRHARIAVEYDGVDAHLRTEEQRHHDAARRRWLRERGWTVIVVQLGDFAAGRRARWLGVLRDALANNYTNRRW